MISLWGIRRRRRSRKPKRFRASARHPARRSVVVKIANAFGDQGDGLVVLPLENRFLNRLAERLRKLIPMVAAKDS